MLTMTTLMSSTNAALPKISYIKSIDVYLGTCFVMVFASLLEYATVGYMGKRIAMRKNRHTQVAKFAQSHRISTMMAAAAAAAAASSKSSGHPSNSIEMMPPGTPHPPIAFADSTTGESPRARMSIANTNNPPVS